MEKRYLFRADGNAKIGLGHIMRSLTIADALSSLVDKEIIAFVCAKEESGRLVRERGYEALILDSDYSNMEAELPAWESLGIKDARILVDSYHTSDSYLQALSQYGRVAIMDDYGKHVFPVDAVVNYNIYANPENYERLYGSLDKTYLGNPYIPVRPQFLNRDYSVRPKISNILITMGGADSMNITGAVYGLLHRLVSANKALNECLADNLKFHVIAGLFSPGYAALKEMEKENTDLIVYHNVTDMDELMLKCDLAITAGGSTVYELSAIGLPFICLSYVDNQEAAVDYIGRHLAYNAGAYDREPEKTLKNIEDAFLNKYMDYEFRQKLSEKEKALVDGKGANRIAKMLMSF